MPRYKLTIEYDGSAFMGWQWQDHGPSIQGSLQRAAGQLNGSPVEVIGAGRTDSGVHALGQVAHLDLDKELRTDTVRDAVNQHLKPDLIAVLDCEQVDEDFHARFSATKRHYIYRIIDRRPPLTLDKGKIWRVPVKLDVDAMHQAAQRLAGQHDFSTFRDAQCQADSPVKTLDAIAVRRVADEVELTCSALSFLHRQVRSITGSLVEIGRGKWTETDLVQALKARDRSRCGPVAPADGLYLEKVDYPA
ncbi:tRNA pseudouridine(38-40) synthase TruA [Hyphobacterium sp. HN65]|uniref:tRNA pseudouridine synthase A n=1 Tax=Hyphobacterium lacteum TaxID=3116575 RepID=A0ABU7LNL2_9PROT|nr:tRNA pseudouridine(38-40) synthase TruA [Hyphobacterium sp. HN65]MEE2525487.1 tRNA pseudouridine(38-40) synthase TruA [Hyphobacterium sp. HN65]